MYDAFQGRSKRRHGMKVSTHCGIAHANFYIGDSNSPADLTGFELRRRSALNPMNPNNGIGSDSSKAVKQHPYYPSRDNSPATFPQAHHPVSTNPYFQQHGLGISAGGGIANGTANPLLLRTRNGYFHPYEYASYGTEVDVPTPSFQSINTPTTVNPSLTGIGFNPFQMGGYPNDSSHQHGHDDFEL